MVLMAQDFPVTIWHNPRCGNSRGALQRIRDAGIEPTIVDYLADPPDRAMLQEVLENAGIGARELVRSKEAAFAELALQEADDTALIEAMLAQPILINRPVVFTPRGVRLCRPPELVDGLLP
jgi:arsenate reductase (glutaredoxin)